MKKQIFTGSIIIVLLISTLIILWYRSVHTKVFVTREKTTVPKPNTISQHLSDKTPFDVLLLGYGGNNHDGPYLTDSMMDIHVDPKTKKVFLISIPRDLWVSIPTNGTGGSSWKINAAYSIGLNDTIYPDKQAQFKGPDGGGRMTEYVVSQITGNPVDYFVGMDFSGFAKTIDTLGGIDIHVEPAFDDPGYPDESKAVDDPCGHSVEDIKAFTATVSAEPDIWAYFPCRYQKVHFDAGLTHMDGTHALTYVRSRHSKEDGTDFGRAKRQRNVLVAAEKKIFSISFIPKIIPFIASLKDDVRTDLSPLDIQALIQHAEDLHTYQTVTLALTDQNYLVDTFSSNNQDILIPKDGQDQYANIHMWLSDIFAGKPEPASAVVQVENGTTIPGLAQTATNRLAIKHIQTVPPKGGKGPQVASSVIIALDNNINPSDLALLKKEFTVTDISYQTATVSGYNIRVLVGSNYVKTQEPTPGK